MPNNRRLLFVSHEMTLSGAPIQLAYLVQWLRAAGWGTTVVAPVPGPLEEKLKGIEVVYDAQLLIDPAYGGLRRLIPQFDGVVANTIATWEAVQAAHLESVPVIWYIHESQVGLQLMKLVHMMEPSLELADAVVTPTRAAAQIYSAFRRKPIEVIPYGIPDVGSRGKKSDDGLSFVTIGTYEHRKGQDLLLEAIRLAALARVSFRFAGRILDDCFYRELQKMKTDLPNVQLLASLGHAEAMQLLAESDVLVCPSRDETMPIVMLEAMSLGKAIVSTRVGGIGEWLTDRENALLVACDNATELAAALKSLVADAALRERLGQAARRSFEQHFTIDRYGREFEALICRVTAA